MVATIHTHDLLSALRTLYIYISRMCLDQRLNLHNKPAANVSVDISERLHQHIDRLSASGRKDSAIIATQADATADGVMVTPISSSRRNAAVVVTQVNNGLRDHLQHRRNTSVNEISLGRQLQKSAWHHLQTSLSNARKGNEPIAKMHAKIASQAIKEAHKYLDEKSYNNFVTKVQACIST